MPLDWKKDTLLGDPFGFPLLVFAFVALLDPLFSFFLWSCIGLEFGEASGVRRFRCWSEAECASRGMLALPFCDDEPEAPVPFR